MASTSVDYSACRHLVVVCAHGIWLGGPTGGRDEEEWAIEDFQAGETPTFIAHIKAGVEAFLTEPDKLLVFSGGPTKPHITDLTEGESYRSLAYALYPSLRSDTPIVADTLATDSFQNVLFSLLLFCTKTGRAPERMTIVSHAFKQSRFIYLHCHALRYPASRVTYIGIDPPQDEERTRAIEAGNVKVLRGWSADRFGRGEDLTGKRVKRGWDDKCLLGPDFEGWKGDLARWSGGDSKNDDFPAKLPWE